MLRFRSQTLLRRIVMGLALVLTLSLGASAATGDPPCGPPGNPCSESAQYVVTDALPSAVAGRTSPSQQHVIGARMPTAGPLTYEDLKLLEARAWGLLTTNKEFRQDIAADSETGSDSLTASHVESGRPRLVARVFAGSGLACRALYQFA